MLVHLLVLAPDQRGTPELHRVRLPAGLAEPTLALGQTYAFPIKTTVDRDSGKLRLALRADVPVVPIELPTTAISGASS